MRCGSCDTEFFVDYENHPSSEVNYCPYCGELYQEIVDYREYNNYNEDYDC